MKKIVPILILVAAIAGATWHFLQKDEGAVAVLGGSGTIEGTRAEVTAKIAGRIVAIAATEGQRVSAGDVLVELAHDELDQQLATAKAAVIAADANIAATKDQKRLAETNLRLANIEYNRAKKLRASGSVSQQALDHAKAARDSLRVQKAATTSAIAAAEALRQQAEAQVGYVESTIANARLACPVDGVVVTRNLEVGENAFPGSSVLSIVDDRNLWVKVYVGGDAIGLVKLGAKAGVTIDSFADRSFPGTVTYVSPTAEFTPKNVQTQEERVRLVYAVKVAVDGTDGELKVGMPADVEIAD